MPNTNLQTNLSSGPFRKFEDVAAHFKQNGIEARLVTQEDALVTFTLHGTPISATASSGDLADQLLDGEISLEQLAATAKNRAKKDPS